MVQLHAIRLLWVFVIQITGMSETELQELARHMGHELAVHRQFYRLQEDVTELAKISKLLIAVEQGRASQFRGLTMDDIQMEGHYAFILELLNYF